MMSYASHKLEAEIAVDRGYTPPCRDKLSSLVFAKHPETKSPLNTSDQDTVSVELKNGAVGWEITVVERFLNPVVNRRIASPETGEGCNGTEGLGILS